MLKTDRKNISLSDGQRRHAIPMISKHVKNVPCGSVLLVNVGDDVGEPRHTLVMGQPFQTQLAVSENVKPALAPGPVLCNLLPQEE